MSLQLSKYVSPKHCKIRFNVESGTLLRVCTHDGNVYVGTVSDSEYYAEVLNLEHVSKLLPNKDYESMSDALALEPHKISYYEILILPSVEKNIKETSIETLSSREDFQGFENYLLEKKPVKVGIYFCGLNIGRKGELYCIGFNLEDGMVIIIDCIAMVANYEGFMMRLDTILFSNENILKIAYNSRPIADYLYHYHSIYLKNVFDIQVTHLFLWMSGQTVNEIEERKGGLRYAPLYNCLETFLDAETISEQNLELLKEYEENEKLFHHSNHPLKERPITDARARRWLVLQVVHLLKLHDVMNEHMMKRPTECVTAHISSHVASEGVGSNDASRLTVPPAIIQKFVSAKAPFSGLPAVDTVADTMSSITLSS